MKLLKVFEPKHDKGCIFFYMQLLPLLCDNDLVQLFHAGYLNFFDSIQTQRVWKNMYTTPSKKPWKPTIGVLG